MVSQTELMVSVGIISYLDGEIDFPHETHLRTHVSTVELIEKFQTDGQQAVHWHKS